MKKYLIALPLVLIMILSMVPVMAAPKSLSVDVTYYKNPQKTESFPKETRTIEVDEALLTDAAKLKAEVEKKVRALGFPKLDTAVQPEWELEVKVDAQTTAPATFTGKPATMKMTFGELQKEGAKFGITFVVPESLNPQPKETDYVADPLATKYEEKAQLLIDNGEGVPASMLKITLADKDVVAVEGDVSIMLLTKVAGEVTGPKATAEAYPLCEVKPEDPKKPWCPELCEFIVVRVYDVFAGEEIVPLRREYKVDPHKVPTFEGIYNHYMRNYFPHGVYQILKDWRGQNDIYYPEGIERDCVIEIYVLPTEIKVDVVHEMWDCCETLDGVKKFTLWRRFFEESVYVDFIAYHSDLVFNHEKAKVFADTRLQKINANDFVFIDAFFDDGVRVDGYMTGKVYDFYGNETTIKNVNPRITLRYERAGCQKEEEKVDNATVENNANTQAPVTASGTQLPATGAKDVTAFFLSAVALLGLGIFFAKKH